MALTTGHFTRLQFFALTGALTFKTLCFQVFSSWSTALNKGKKSLKMIFLSTNHRANPQAPGKGDKVSKAEPP